MLGKSIAIAASLAVILTLVACQGQAAPTDPRFSNPPTPTGTPTGLPNDTPTNAAAPTPNDPVTVIAYPTTVGPVATRVILPAGGGSVALPPRQIVPATGTPVAQNTQIEIVGASAQHTTIASGETATVSAIANTITVIVHYPVPVGSEVNGSFQPYPIAINVDPPDWQATGQSFPNAQTLQFQLTGSASGPHRVAIQVPRLGAPISFTVNIGSATVPPAGTPSGERTLTIADNGQTITLKQGDRFLLSLPEGYNWQVSIGDPSVVSYATGFMAPAGTQGLYVARQPGKTSFSASGEPPCRTARPACGLPNRLFQVTIVVQ